MNQDPDKTSWPPASSGGNNIESNQTPNGVPQPNRGLPPTSNIYPTPSVQRPMPSSPPDSNRRWPEIISTILLLTLAPIVALLIILFAIQSYQVDGQSMEPTLQNRDRLIVDRIPRTMARITGHHYMP